MAKPKHLKDERVGQGSPADYICAAHLLKKDHKQTAADKAAPSRDKWASCVHKVQKKGDDVDPYAVCTTSVGVPPKKEEADSEATSSPAPALDAETPDVQTLLVQNPGMNAATFLNLMKAKGFKVVKEAELSNPALNRAQDGKKESHSLGATFISSRFLEASKTDKGAYENRYKVILIQEGLGNTKDGYYYTKEALQSAVPVFEGRKMYADHPSSEEERTRPERSVKDVYGHFENVTYKEAEDGTGQLLGDLVLLPDDATDWVRARIVHAIDYAKKFPDKDFIGLSINASGDAQAVDALQFVEQGNVVASALAKLKEAISEGLAEVRVVNTIDSAVSCDLVTEAGAKGKVLEMLESQMKKVDSEEGGPGSGRYPKGSKGEQPSDKPSKKGAAKASGKRSEKDVLGALNKIEQSGAGFFSRNSDDSFTVNVRGAHGNDPNQWHNARAIQNHFGSLAGEITPDPMSGHLVIKVKNPSTKTKENEKMEKDLELKKIGDEEKKKEADASEAAPGEEEEAPAAHGDEEQDKALILDQLKKHGLVKGEEEEGDEAHKEAAAEESAKVMAAAKHYHQAYKQAGYKSEEAAERAVEAMKCAEIAHGAMKQAEAEECKQSEAEEGEEKKEAHKESSAVLKLKGENAKLLERLGALETEKYLDKKLRESKLPMSVTKKFKESCKGFKSTKEVDEKFSLFCEGYKAVGGEALSALDACVAVDKESNMRESDGGISLEDCVE